MNTNVPAAHLSHDAIDAFVAKLASFCHRLVPPRTEMAPAEIAFSDEWERRQIARELHLN